MKVKSFWQNQLDKSFYYKKENENDIKKLKNNFQLFFDKKDINKMRKILYSLKIDKKFIKKVEDNWKDVFGKQIVKTEFNSKMNYYKYKQIIDSMKSNGLKTYGTSMLNIFPYEVVEDFSEKKLWFLDIEVIEKKSQNIFNGEIISITIFDSDEGKYYSIITIPYETAETRDYNENYIFVKNELELMKCFNKLLKSKKPDVISGWYSEGYDIPYIINRAKNYKIELSVIPGLYSNSKTLDIGGRKITKNYIPGIDLVDYLELYKKYVFTQPTSFKLSTVAKFHDLKGKTEEKGFFNYRKDFKRFIDYAIRDVEILVELEQKLNLLNLLYGLQAVIKIPVNYLMANSIAIEHFLNQFLFEEKVTVQDNAETKNDPVDVEGAIVLQPEDKTYNDVVVLDYASLYPNIIVTYNISPETLIESKNINPINYVDLTEMYKGEDKNESVKFTLEKEGIFPRMINFLLAERLKYKKMAKEAKVNSSEKIKYDIKQLNYKILLNSMYGVIGTARFPLHDKRCSSAITTASRNALRYLNKKLNKTDFKVKIENQKIHFETEVIYSDTDSSFDHIKIKSEIKSNKKIILKIAEYLAKHINNIIAEELPTKYSTTDKIKDRTTLAVDVDKLFKKVKFFGVKKRYFGIDYEDKIITHGVEVVRKDTPASIKKILSELFIYALKDEIKKEYLLNSYNEIKKLKLEDIAIFKNITKRNFNKYKMIPNQVRAIIVMQKLFGFEYTLNDSVLYYPVIFKDPKTFKIVSDVFNITPKNNLELKASLAIEYEHVEKLKELIEKDIIEIDYLTIFEKNILTRLEQFSETIKIIQKVRYELGIITKNKNLKLF
ncbi:MAG: DNA polymerase domain-containing protein [Thermotogota bacterium]